MTHTPQEPDDQVKIYLAPNLMTAGNLICGFTAVLKIFEGILARQLNVDEWEQSIYTSLYLILGACIFDLLDGRVARISGRANAFGREFDSLADVVSFGVAPALLIFNIVLHDFQSRTGWVIASLYLVCGCLRLARFNVLATISSDRANKEFTGLPIPAAAGLIASITLWMLNYYENLRAFQNGSGKHFLGALMVFCSFMMFSKFRYPSFKHLNWRAQHTIPKFIGVILLVFLIISNYRWMLAVVFTSYLFYGFTRPFISRAVRREIEDDEEVADLP